MVPIVEEGRHIDGLVWDALWSVPNGNDSCVVPIPTLRPVNIVFKGDQAFSYGHYGVHLGQMDRLIFIGSIEKTVTAYFIDCRQNSPTFRQRLVTQFKPSSTRLLCIPPGVAHTFDTQATNTVNLYSMFLPEPDEWLSGRTKWTIAGDILNVPMDVKDGDIPELTANARPASDTFYKLVAAEQAETIANLRHEYPFTHEVDFRDGTHENLKFWKRLEARQMPAAWQPIEGISGAVWKRNLVVWTGQQSGYVPLVDRRPKHLIDHGESEYTHDAFGIHVGGDDHLIFVGPASRKAVCELVDCRKGSSTLHRSVTFEFAPDPLTTLIIPRGVAHRFEHLDGIFTINQPLTFLPDDNEYSPAHDVTDWPIPRRPFPELEVNQREANPQYYAELSARQFEMTAHPAQHSTPSVIMTKDAQGQTVRVAFTKRLAEDLQSRTPLENPPQSGE